MRLTARPLDAAALAPFATVLDGAHGATFPAVLEPGNVPGAAAFTLLCLQPGSSPATLTMLERHPHSTQSFLPIQSGRWLVLVAPTAPDGSPDMAAALAFVAGPEDAICIHRDVWHAGLTVFDRPARFGMIMWKAAQDEDGVVYTLADPAIVTI